uniref:CYtochrome P450 family n=1 Tax=Caenorhabditis japonica TaxID=281687 RepID=A0A8R1HLI3_CAEJA
MLALLLVTTILTIAFLHQWVQRRRLPKGPTPLPVLGNLHQLSYYFWRHHGVVEAYRQFEKQYGKVFTVWIGPLPTVYIADYDVAYETHVKRANTFGARFAVGALNYIREGRGILVSNGEFWQEHRRFALQTLRNFGLGKNLMEEKIMEEYRHWFAKFSNKNNNNKETGAAEASSSMFFDLLIGSIINQLLTSERFEQNDPDFAKLKESLSIGLEKFGVFEIFCPDWVLDAWWMKWRMDAILDPFRWIHALSQRNVQRRVEAIERSEHVIDDEGADFIDAYLVKIEKDRRDGVKNSSFNLENLAIDIYDLWIAGQETTSTTLSWACACLLNHPQVVSKAREELVAVTGGHRPVSLTDKTKTPYLNATINEVQRIASILNVNLFRQVSEDTIIDGQPIAAGTALTTHLALIHTDETLFKDHTQFRPERFLEEPNNNLEKKLIPFGIGKRSCLGESLARAELYLVLGNMIVDYDLEAVGEKPSIKTTSPFGIMKRPPVNNMRFVPVVRMSRS